MARRPASAAWRVLGKGLSPICSSTTSLPAALSRFATARTSKAVSAERDRAKALRGAWLMVVDRVGSAVGLPLVGLAFAAPRLVQRALSRKRPTRHRLIPHGYCLAA